MERWTFQSISDTVCLYSIGPINVPVPFTFRSFLSVSYYLKLINPEESNFGVLWPMLVVSFDWRQTDRTSSWAFLPSFSSYILPSCFLESSKDVPRGCIRSDKVILSTIDLLVRLLTVFYLGRTYFCWTLFPGTLGQLFSIISFLLQFSL